LPDGTQLNFPDGMSEDEMRGAIESNFPQFAAPKEPAGPPGMLTRMGQAIKEAITSVPILAPGEEDLGVMGSYKPGTEPKVTAPAGMGPMYDQAYAKVLADEYKDPLDPRLAAIAPADALAKMQVAASHQHAKSDDLWRRVMDQGAIDAARDKAEHEQKLRTYSAENLAGNFQKNVRNAAASTLKIGPTALKGVFDIAQLATGGKVGAAGSASMAEGMKAIDDAIADPTLGEQGKAFQALMADPNADLTDMYNFLKANPEIMIDNGITTIGSMFLPAGAAKGAVSVAGRMGASAAAAGTAATIASTATVAAQNASDTFTSDELKDASLSDRYRGAAFSAGMSVLAGMIFHGGAEGEIARRMAGVKSAGTAAGKMVKAVANEGMQEMGEELGNAGGEFVATSNAPGGNNLAKRVAFAGALGAVLGAGSHVSGAGHQAEDPAAAAAAAAEAARQAALAKWTTQGLSPNQAPPAPPAAPAAPAPTVADIGAASSVDDAIAAAQAVMAQPPAGATSSAAAIAAEIDALEQGGMLGTATAPNATLDGDPARAMLEQLGHLPAAPAAEAAPGAPGAPTPSVWRRANDPTIPTLNDVLAGPDGIPTLNERPDIPTLNDRIDGIPTLTDVFSSRDQDGQEWHHFPAETGTLGIPRSSMPQIKAEHRGALVNFLNARGITHDQVEVHPHTLKPTQAEFSLAKVQKALDYQGGNRSILISSDGHVVDGHHQWLGDVDQGTPTRAIRLNAPIRQLLDTVKEFPSATTSEGEAGAPRIKYSPDWRASVPLAEDTKQVRAKENAIDYDLAQATGMDRGHIANALHVNKYSPEEVFKVIEASSSLKEARKHVEWMGESRYKPGSNGYRDQQARLKQLRALIEGDNTPWHASPFAPRIDKLLGDLRTAGVHGMAKAIETGLADEARRGQLDEEKVAFREDKARQAIADHARENGQVQPAEHVPMTPEGMAKVTNTAAALPAPIVAAAVKKWNEIAPKLAELGYKPGEAHSNAPHEAQQLERKLKEIVNALDGLAARRYQVAKAEQRNAKLERQGKPVKPIDRKHLNRNEEAATLALGIKTKRHPGVDTSAQVTLGTGVVDPAVRAAEARRQAERLRERLRSSNPFLAFLANHGISPADRADLGVEPGQKGNPPVPGYGPVIRKTGKRLDELALLAEEEGFITQHDIDSDEDTGGTRKLASMIQRALANKEVIRQPAAIDSQMEAAAHGQLAAEAESLGIDTTGKDYGQLYDEVVAAHQAREDRREAIGAESVEDQALIENYADLITADELADAQLDDIQLDGGRPMNDLTEEELDAIFGSQKAGSARSDQGEADGNAAGNAPEGAGRAATESEGTDELLTSYSAADVVARQDAEETAAKARQAERDRLEQQRKREDDAKQTKARIEDSADNFQLGQSAESAVFGQDSLFDNQAPVDDAAIDRAATAGYQAGKAGKMAPPFNLDDEELMAWRIGNQRARDEAMGNDGAEAEADAALKELKSESKAPEPETKPAKSATKGTETGKLTRKERELQDAIAEQDRQREAEAKRLQEAREYWKPGMLASLPAVASIEGEQWMQYTIGANARIESIDGDNVTVRIETPGHKQDGKLARVSIGSLGEPLNEAEGRSAFLSHELAKIVQPRVHQYNADNARPLLLIACSGAKLEGRHKAVDLYKGVMFDVLRKWMPTEGVRPDVWILSAEHGLVHGDTMLDSYERPMDKARQRQLIDKGLDVDAFKGKDFNQVFIAGGELYRDLAQTYIQRLRQAGFIGQNAAVNAVSGGIGEQRGQLGEYLRQLGANATDDTQVQSSSTEQLPNQLPDLAGQETALAIEEMEAKPVGDLSEMFHAMIEEEAEAMGLNEPGSDRSALFNSILEEEAGAMGLNDEPAAPAPEGLEAEKAQLAKQQRKPAKTIANNTFATPDQEAGRLNAMLAIERAKKAKKSAKTADERKRIEKERLAAMKDLATLPAGRFTKHALDAIRLQVRNNNSIEGLLNGPDSVLARLENRALEQIADAKKAGKSFDYAYDFYNRDGDAMLSPEYFGILWDGKEGNLEQQQAKSKGAKTVNKQRAAQQRMQEVLGAKVGDTITMTFNGNVGYLTSGKAMTIERVSSTGEIYFKDANGDSRTSEKLAMLEAYAKNKHTGLKWEVTPRETGIKTTKQEREEDAHAYWMRSDDPIQRALVAPIAKLGKIPDVYQSLKKAGTIAPQVAEHIAAHRKDLRGEVNAVMRDELGYRKKAGEWVKDDRTAGQAAVDAVKNTAIGYAAALGGIGEALGIAPQVKQGVMPFEESKYERVKPYFTAAIEYLGEATHDIKVVMRAIVRDLLKLYGKEGTAKMEPYVLRYIDDFEAGKIKLNGESNADSGTSNDTERDPGNRPDEERETEPDVFDVRPRSGGRTRAPGAGPDEAGTGSADRAGVPGRDAATGGAQGDRDLPGVDGGRGPGASTAEPRDTAGGRDGGNAGAKSQSDAIGEPATALGARLSLDEKRLEQLAAEAVDVVPGDRANIDATLPFLLPPQRDDVHFAETRFAQADKKPGVVFTNGTGTGKTFTGLGIAKRFERQGKGNGIIVVPNNEIAQDWIDSGKNLGLNITALDSTTDAGKGMVITTYANFGDNATLADRTWDFVLPDEAHYLMASKDGKMTDALQTLRALTRHPEGFARYSRMVNRDIFDQLAAVPNKDSEQAKKLWDQLRKREEPQREEFAAVASSNLARPKAVFLSATPFAYIKAVDWAEGYLFEYPADGRIGNSNQDGRAHFFVQHFGYRIRYHKLTEPDANVNQGLMARQFNEWLKKEGALSGRMLDVEADYDRKFVMIPSALGTKIDEGLEYVREHPEYKHLYQPLMKQFSYLARRYLLEAIKAKESLPMIQEHLDRGRKVIVIHDYKKGGAFNPFTMQGINGTHGEWDGNTYKEIDLAELADKFKAERRDLVNLKFPTQSALQILTGAYPNALVHNGDVADKQLADNKRLFNADNFDNPLLILQADKGREGISLHDTTGRYMRVQVNVGMPAKPTALIQLEGRSYRTGQVTDAPMRYVSTGTMWERWTFAQTIAERADIAEALAMGEQARGLKESIIEAYEDAGPHPVSDDDGKGGKARDRQNAKLLTEWDRAKSFYYGQLKRNSSTKAAEGKDYFATPEPVGLKMVEWADIRTGESVLEPSAGHGAIARWFPAQSAKTIVEPETALITKTRLAIEGPGKFVQSKFEDLHLVNKYDAIVMNPPFGKGGSLSTPHLAKAYKHLNEGGRIVALLPTGPDADKRFDKFLYGDDAPKDLHLVAHILLPSATFGRAGTGAMTRIVVLDKLADEEMAPVPMHRDYTHIEDVEGLFDALENVTLPGRTNPSAGEDVAIEEAKPTPTRSTKPARTAEPGATGAERYFAQFEFDHTQTGVKQFGAAMLNRTSTDAYKAVLAIAKQHGGRYSTYAGGNAKRGFLFKTAEARADFMAEAGKLDEVSAGLAEQNSLAGDLGIPSTLLDHMEEIADHRGMFQADKLLEWVRTQDAPGAAGLANWLEVQRDALVTPSSVVKYIENSGNEMFSKFNPGRRQLLAAAAAAAMAPAAKADVKLGQTKALPAAVLGQRVAPAIEKLLRDGQAGGTTSLNGLEALRKALKAMSLTGPKEVRNLALQVANLLPTKGTLMLTVDDTRRMNVHGVVSLVPMLHMQLFTAEGRTGLTYETVLHEAMHVAIAARYRSLSVGLARENDALLGLSAPAAAKALEQFEGLWNEFRQLTIGEKFANSDLELAIAEARGNPDEFFVRSLTDPVLQAYLAGKRYEGKTMWQRFKDWVRTSLFGLRESGTAPSWLDAALYASGDVLEAMGGDRADFARMRAINQYQDGRRGQAMRSAANDDTAAANTSPLTMAARRRFDQVMTEAEHWLKSNGKTAHLLDLEPRWAMDSLDMMMGFGVANMSEQAKAQGRAIWDRASEAYKNLARRGGELEVGPDEMYARASSVAPTWTEPGMTMQDNIIQTLQDKHVDMKRVVQAIREQNGQLADRWDPYLQEELFHGRAATGFKSFLEDELRPLLTDMQARGVSMEQLEEFLHMRHAEEANDRLASINQGNPDGLAGVSTADARAYLAGLSPAQRQAYGALAARVDAIIAGTQRALVDYGLEKQDTIDTWNRTYQHYVPLMREDMDSPLKGNGTGSGFSVRGSASKARMGSKRAVVDILANVAMARERAIVRGEKNRLDLALYGLALQAPNPEFWKPVNPQKNPQALMAELANMGLSPALVQAIIDEPKQRQIDRQTGMVISRVNPVLRNAPNVVAVRVNGEDRFIFFNEKNERAMRMALSLKNLGNDGLNRFLNIMGMATRWFASVNTQYNPVFGIVNFTRDIGEGAVNLESTPIAGQQAAFAKEAGRLFGAAARQGFRLEQLAGADAALWSEFQREGGITGYRAMFSTSEDRGRELAKELRKMQAGQIEKAGRAVLDWLSDYNEALENVTRLAAYKTAKANGMSNQQAASLAKNLTVNFNRKGAIGSQVNSLFAFFNAATQGIARMGETLAGPAGKKIVAGGMLLGVLQAFMLLAAGYDDDNPPEFVKAKNFVIPLGLVTGKKDFLTIPYPLGYSFLPTIGRTVTEFGIGGGKKIGKHLANVAGALLDTFNPIGNGNLVQVMTPTVADPIVDLAINKDWTGKPIAREDRSGLHPTPGFTRTKDTASGLGKGVSYALNAITGGNKYQAGLFSPTPDQVDYLAGQLTGGVGREALKAWQTGASLVTGEELPAHKVPLAGRFYGQADDKSAASTKFYENLKELNGMGDELKGRQKDHANPREFLAEHPEARLAEMGAAVERDIAELRKRKSELMEKGASRDRIKENELQQRKLMQRFNEKVQEVKAKSAA
jgi:hypothetical protein